MLSCGRQCSRHVTTGAGGGGGGGGVGAGGGGGGGGLSSECDM